MNQNSKVTISMLFILGVMGIALAVIGFNSGEIRVGEPVVKRRSHGTEFLVLRNKDVAEALSGVDVKMGSEIIRKEVSRISLSKEKEGLDRIDAGLVKFREEVGTEVDIVKMGRGVRLAHILNEAGMEGEARVVLGIITGRAINGYSEGLEAVREIVASKGENRYKVRVEQLEEVLSVVVINRVLELNLPVESLIKDMVNAIKWEDLGDGTEVGRVYLLQLVGLYAGGDYYTSGLFTKLRGYWLKKLAGDNKDFFQKPRVIEAFTMFKVISGSDPKKW